MIAIHADRRTRWVANAAALGGLGLAGAVGAQLLLTRVGRAAARS